MQVSIFNKLVKLVFRPNFVSISRCKVQRPPVLHSDRPSIPNPPISDTFFCIILWHLLTTNSLLHFIIENFCQCVKMCSKWGVEVLKWVSPILPRSLCVQCMDRTFSHLPSRQTQRAILNLTYKAQVTLGRY